MVSRQGVSPRHLIEVRAQRDVTDLHWFIPLNFSLTLNGCAFALVNGPLTDLEQLDGTFVLYFSASHHANPRFHCVGTATSPNVTGPYTPASEPLTCPFSQGGAIDPTFIHDPRKDMAFVVYKNDGNAIGTGGACSNTNWPNTPTSFQFNIVDTADYTTRVGNDTWTPIGNSTWILFSDRGDGPNVESPQIFYRGTAQGRFAPADDTTSAYHLIYNAGCYADESYRIEHIVCRATDLNVVSDRWEVHDASYVPFFRDCDFGARKPGEYRSWGQKFLGFKDSIDHHYDLLIESGTFRQRDGSGDAVELYAPGGPAVVQDGKYMAFHADISRDWFEGKVCPGCRVRALFIAELEYDAREGTGLSVKRLIKPIRK